VMRREDERGETRLWRKRDREARRERNGPIRGQENPFQTSFNEANDTSLLFSLLPAS
jgi:hypothetical protein